MRKGYLAACMFFTLMTEITAYATTVSPHGGSALSSPKVYAIFSGESASYLADHYASMLAYLATGPFLSGTGEYGGAPGSFLGESFAASWTGPLSENDLSRLVDAMGIPRDSQSACVILLSASNGNPYPSAEAYHTLLGSPSVPCAVIPFNGSNAQSYGALMAHELAETVTDPYLNGWYLGDHDEISDLCGGQIYQLANGNWAQKYWSNQNQACISSGELHPQIFTLNTKGALYQSYWDGISTWKTHVLDESANLTRFSVYSLPGSVPQVFGITQNGSLYQAYFASGWRHRILYVPPSGISLVHLEVAVDDSYNPQVFAILSDGALFQAFWSGTQWVTRNLDPNADLVSLSLYSLPGRIPQAFGTNRHGDLYQAFWSSTWQHRLLYKSQPGLALVTLQTIVDDSANPQIFAIASNGGLFQAFWSGAQWVARILDNNADLASLSVFSLRGLIPQAFGITHGGALYQAFSSADNRSPGPNAVASNSDRPIWKHAIIDSQSDLTAIKTVVDDGYNPQIFAIDAKQELYQAFWTGNSWSHRTLDNKAGLTTLFAFEVPGQIPELYGITDTGALYQSFFRGDQRNPGPSPVTGSSIWNHSLLNATDNFAGPNGSVAVILY